MATRRRQAREIALQALFQADVGELPLQEAIAVTLEEHPVDDATRKFAETLAQGTWEHREELDAVIREYAPHWALERMANVDRNILRMALFEILHLPDIPFGVSINEAVELAKQYGTAESGKFVNGVLGAFVRKLGTKGTEGTKES